MNLDAQEEKKDDKTSGSDMPKHKQLIHMMTFRVVPAYYKEIEKVAAEKKMSVSKLIRTYIKEGMRKDGELTSRQEKEFKI